MDGGKIVCSKCARSSEEGDVYCSSCGTKLREFRNLDEVDSYVLRLVQDEVKRLAGYEKLITLSVAKNAEESVIKTLKWYVAVPLAVAATLLILFGLSSYDGIQKKLNDISARVTSSNEQARHVSLAVQEAESSVNLTKVHMKDVEDDVARHSVDLHSREIALGDGLKKLESALKNALQQEQDEFQKAQVMSAQLENLDHSLNNTVPQIIRKADDAELSQRYPFLGQHARVTYDG